MKFPHQFAAERNGRWIWWCAFALGLVLLAPAGVGAAERTRILLREGWFIKQLDSDQPDITTLAGQWESADGTWLAARMPAQVHDVLLAHGKITDPRIGRNAAESAWVGGKDWAYGCRFSSPEIGDGPVFLRFGGLDTLATAYLNGQPIGQFNNMYREYAVDVRAQLAAAGRQNTLLVVFSSPLRFVDKVQPRPDQQGVPNTHYCANATAISAPTWEPVRTRPRWASFAT